MDYCFVNVAKEKDATISVISERETGAVECTVVQEKGPSMFPVEIIDKVLKYWGLSRIVLYSDQEPAMVALGNAVQAFTETAILEQISSGLDSGKLKFTDTEAMEKLDSIRWRLEQLLGISA